MIKPVPKVTCHYGHSSPKIIGNNQNTPITCTETLAESLCMEKKNAQEDKKTGERIKLNKRRL